MGSGEKEKDCDMINKIKSVKNVWHQYQFLLTRSQKRWGIVVFLLSTFGAVCETLGVSAMLPLIQVIIMPDRLRQNEYLAPIFDIFQVNSDAALMCVVSGAVILIYIIKNIILLFVSYVSVKYSCKVQRELSVEMMDSYMQRGYVFFLDSSLSHLLRGMQSSISSTYSALNQFFKLVSEFLTIFFICIFIIFTDWTMAICIIVLSGLCLLAIVLGFQKTVRKASKESYELCACGNRILIQAFEGIKEVLVMKREKFFVKKYRENYAKQQKALIGQTLAVSSPAYIIEAICVTGLMITVCIKAITTGDSVNLVAQLGAFAVAAFRILPSLGRISSYFNQFMACVPGINETYENFVKAREAVAKRAERICASETEEIVFSDKLCVDNVSWSYPSSDKIVLKNISLDIRKGESIAFVGKSGAGKTTLADVILGLLIPQEGHIYLDGIDIQIIQGNWHKVIGFVPQNVNLQDDTVRRNVAFGIDDKEIDDDRVWKALEQAQMKDIIEESKNGLDTMIGERGIRFSGGQKQRFAIARALYYDPDILVLDEATAALDTETERAVMESIQLLSGNKTLIIIAHRITTIRQCDKIYRIENGKAVEVKYEELT